MELLERGSYLADLTAWFAAVDERGGCIALVRGEAGIGKTFLLNEFSRQQRETRVLWGACDALFTPRPLAPLHDVARQAQGPLLAAINSGANRDKIFAAMLDELERTKTLVVFEDLHWADEATLDLLKYLGRRIQRSRAMLVVTYRDDEVDPRHPLRSVIGDLPRPSTHRMSLSPLSEPAVAILATRAGRPSGGLHGVTGGNPLFVTEILAAVAGAVPSTVRDAVLARVGRLGPAARDVAELVSVVPAKTERWLLDPLPSGTRLPAARSRTPFPPRAGRVCMRRYFRSLHRGRKFPQHVLPIMRTGREALPMSCASHPLRPCRLPPLGRIAKRHRITRPLCGTPADCPRTNAYNCRNFYPMSIT
jgi:hypothetical protein